MVLTEGQVLDGKYVIVRVLASGSMGEVYLGRNERIGKEVAVKVLRGDLAEEPAIANRFEREARIATAVKSAHVVDVYDLGELPSGERFIVMEYVEGESLATRIGREGKLAARAVGGIALQILDGLVAAHEAGVVHRDLKPDNVILTRRDNQEIVKLVDFGISKLSEKGDGASKAKPVATSTLHGMLLGTPMYMSPEQARGEPDAVDLRTDIFSLGVTMYEALSGDVPFTADNVVTLLSKVMSEDETPLEERTPGVDPALARIVKKAMAKDPADRYQTASEMRDAVAEWYAVFGSASAMRSSFEGVSRPTSAPPESPAPRVFALPFSLPFALTLPFTLRDSRTRTAVAAAAIAATITGLVVHRSEPPPVAAEDTVAAAAHVAERDPIVVPTVPVRGEEPVFSVPALLVASTATATATATTTATHVSSPPPAARPRAAKATTTTHAPVHTDADAAAPAPSLRDAGATTREAGAAAPLAPLPAKTADEEASAETPTPPPDPPAIP